MNPRTRDILESIYNRYHKPQYLELDPVQYVREFKSPFDIEIAGLVASSLAYGRVEIIRSSIRQVFSVTGKNLLDFVRSTSFPRKRKLLHGFKHRFNDGFDLALLFECAAEVIQSYGSLQSLFLAGVTSSDNGTIKQPLDEFTKRIRTYALKIAGTPRKSFEYFFPFPKEGSACKRLNMFLRWMVRGNDGIDLGIWKAVHPSILVIPVDTHIAGIGERLSLTTRRTADWRMAEEITWQLKKISPSDPVKYDFSLCRAGMDDFRSSSTQKSWISHCKRE